MSWRNSLRPAKLGAAPFLVESTDATIGRNTQIHEYPLRDKPVVEDLGRRPRHLTLEAYVIGPNYMSARDALIKELESAGSKTLTHPYLGELKVTVIEATGPRESTREGGSARFTITVVESGERQFPSASVNTAQQSKNVAASAGARCGAACVGKLQPVSTPAFILDSLTHQVQGFSNTLKAITAKVTTVPEPLAHFMAALTDLSGSASALVLVPQTLVSRMQSLIYQTRDIVNQPIAALNIVRDLFHYGDDLPFIPLTTSNRTIEAANQTALVEMVRQSAAIAAAQISADVEFASREDALAVRDELIEVIDAQLEQLGDFEVEFPISDEEYFALVEVRTAMVKDLETRGAKLALLVPLTLIESTPALVIAYDRYLDVSRDAEIIARNAVRDPNFVNSGRALQVLTDG